MFGDVGDFLKTHSLSEVLEYIKEKPNEANNQFRDAYHIFYTLTTKKNNDSKDCDDLKLKSWVLASTHLSNLDKTLSQINLLNLSPSVKKDLVENVLDPKSRDLKSAEGFLNELLINAIEKQNVDEVKHLVARGVPTYAQNRNSPLLLAITAVSPSIEIIELLIKNGASLDVKDNDGFTPLHIALLAKPPSIEIIELLLKNGAPLDIQDKNGYTPLHLAIIAKSPSIEIITLLLKNGAPLDIQDKRGYTPLHLAIIVKSPSIEITELLLAHNPPPLVDAKDKKRETPLHLALKRPLFSPEIVRLLLDKGADPNLVDMEGQTGYSLAELKNFSIDGSSKKQAFSDELGYRRLLATSWGIKHTSELDGQSFEYNEGGRSAFAVKQTLQLLKKFAEHSTQTFDLKKFIDLNEKGIQNGSESVSTVQEKYKAGETLVFMGAGWEDHSVSVVIHGDYMIVANRGMGREKEPLKTYKIDRSKPLTEKAILKLQGKNESNKENGQWFLHVTLPSALKTKKDDIVVFMNKECTQSDQKSDNCWWISPKAGIYSLLALESLLEAKGESHFDVIDKEDAFLEKFGLAQAVYKQFSEFSRLEILREYIDRPPNEMGKDYELVEKILEKLKSKKWKHIFEKEKLDPTSLAYWKNFILGKTIDQYFQPFFNRDEMIKEVEAFLKNKGKGH